MPETVYIETIDGIDLTTALIYTCFPSIIKLLSITNTSTLRTVSNKFELRDAELITSSNRTTKHQQTNMRFLKTATIVLSSAAVALAGPVAYATCQSGCTGLVIACYSAAGFTFGAVLAVGATPAILACNAAFSACCVKCAPLLVAPIP